MAKKKPEVEPQEAVAAEYTVVARRYRPQQFEELIGQESSAQALMNALSGGRVAHAYLFTGARGVGKTSTARILAKALNCEKGPTPHPCDSCAICRSIATGEDVDVLEIDGASNRGIDEVRELRANVQFRPSRGRFKIYIIDEVHMLTTPAFNALLKTLEEPPAGVKFIFATTEVNKIPVTILSRCQRFDFGTIRTERIAAHLKSIVQKENREADDGAIALIARRAAGSMRDGESLLDQLLSFGEPVTPELVHKLLGTAAAERIAAIAQAVLRREPRVALEAISESLAEGVQAGELLDQMIEFWRDMMLVQSCGPEAPGLTNPTSTLQSVLSTANLDAVLAGLDILAGTKSRLKFSTFPRLLVEMAVVRLARLDQILGVGDIWGMLQSGGTPMPAAERLATSIGSTPTATEAEKKKRLSRSPAPNL
ncbi:MAG: DNA polymerase III subunit gamma/tau [Gemmataceae bacterium]|nr:DNA polymerase III subunit gamma/tau [Gemmataceae bacterium]